MNPADLSIYRSDSKHFDEGRGRLRAIGDLCRRADPESDHFDQLLHFIIESARNDPDYCVRSSCIWALSRFQSHRDTTVPCLIECIYDFEAACGDVYIPSAAIDSLQAFLPLREYELVQIRQALVEMLRTPEAYEGYSYNGTLVPYFAFKEIAGGERYEAHWPEFVREIARGDPKLFTKVIQSLNPFGSLITCEAKFGHIKHILESEHPDSARMMRVWLIAEKHRYEEFLDNEGVDPLLDRDRQSADNYRIIRSFTDLFSPEELEQAQREFDAIDDVDDEFDVFPFHNL